MAKSKYSDKQVAQNKTDSIMNTIAWRCAYYRANPSRFVEEFLGINYLKWFQKILLWCMMRYDVFTFIASRALGKTFLVALFCVCRCILFPGEKIVVGAPTFKQGKELVGKIKNELMHNSPMLGNEIKGEIKMSQNECQVDFKNGSYIVVVACNDNARGKRCTILIEDERRMISQYIVDSVLRPMRESRNPGYLQKPEYAHLKEMPKEFSMSSAWYKASELFGKVKSDTANMFNPRLKTFVVDLPYQVSIQSGIMLPQIIETEMSEASFSDIMFMMEREGKFYGASEDALFNYETLQQRRIIREPFCNINYYQSTGNKLPQKKVGEKRILSIDIALMASKKSRDNDASSFFIHQALPTASNNYIDNIVYAENVEGLLTDELALMAMRYFYCYNCDYMVIDRNGVGMGVLDAIISRDMYDPMTGETYAMLNVCNDDEVALRCKSSNAKKVIYAIKANSKFNNDIALDLRAGFQNGVINLLISEIEAEDQMDKNIKGFNKLSDVQQAKTKLPYFETSMLIEELINLEYETSNGLIKVKEKSGMRKDRYSSIAYGWFVVQQLAQQLKPTSYTTNILDNFTFTKHKNIGLFS